ncbi:MAG TPA: metallophosphoesterase [Symbiobacteriaceae bacterium]|nr:metallophosphoesterase [Symbiobacteriaceae bacterium]
MVRVAVVSDTHGDLSRLGQVQQKLGKVDWLLHAGDFLRDAQPVARQLGVDPGRVRAVIGNCDHHLMEPLQDLFAIEGVSFLLVHGHYYGVKSSLDRMYYKALEAGVRVAVFGHSHVPVSRDEEGLLLFNPGSLSMPRIPKTPPTCGLLEIQDGAIIAARIVAAVG